MSLARLEYTDTNKDQEIEYHTLSSDFTQDKIERPERLHEWLKTEEIELLYSKFSKKVQLTYPELREELENLNIRFTDLEYNRLFLKINQNRDFKCDWNEFISYLIFGFQEDDPSSQKEALILPISSPPLVKKSDHRLAICSIALLRGSTDAEEDDEEDKRFGSDDESDNEEQQNKKLLRNVAFEETVDTAVHTKGSTWLLCISALSDVSIVCTSSTERELRFHETVASTFNLRIVIRSMPYAVCCMSYTFHKAGKHPSRLVMGDYGGNGVTTFYCDERNNLVVTGGPDTSVRIWDVYIPTQTTGLLTGHNAGIVKVFVQSEEKKVYSIDYHKIVKVWDLSEHSLLQSFGDLARVIPGETDLVFHYHQHLRELLIGGRKLVAIKCNPRVRVNLTDGNTHAAPVSVVLYNKLFRNLVTCGLDSYIIVWDPWTGKRKIIMKNCHTKQVYGENIDIEITAACFDPLEQFLLTGARDGSLKVWNYNNAVCIRNMSIKSEHEVTAVVWVVERILAVGWDQQVTEFNDVEGREYSDPKKWPMFHSDDITCADVKLREGVVTATHSGELIFWTLETGQPYRRYNVEYPTEFIELKLKRFGPHSYKDSLAQDDEELSRTDMPRYMSVFDRIKEMEKQWTALVTEQRSEGELKEKASRKIVAPGTTVSVQALLFLQTRPMTLEHGSVFVALETGAVQVYSHHQRGGYITEFNAIHKIGDCVLTMTTDRKNRYLFTGTAIPEREKVKISMPLLRLQFIFLRKELVLTRAKRAVRNQKEPLLLNSFKAHLKAVNSVVFINLPKILITKARKKIDDEKGAEEESLGLYGKSLREPILGKHFQLPGRRGVELPIELDVTSSYIPVYNHLKIHETKSFDMPSTPTSVKRIANEDYMDFYEPIPVRSEGVKSNNLLSNVLKRGRRTLRESVFRRDTILH
uniref:WD repeat-containing protein on Y chromosome n=1 Tax=Glossina brevipalpis TaxID=37001 RepID=A0A1A9WKU8_9MUSC